jgi:hypothetical protein
MAQERTAIEILNAMEDELGLSRSTSVAATTTIVRQRMAHINATLEECQAFGAWAALEKEAIIEFGAPTVASCTLTADSAIVTTASTAFITANSTPADSWLAYGAGGIGSSGTVQRNTRIASVTNATTFVMDKTADASSVEDLSFVQDTFAVPSDYQRSIPQTHWDARLMWSMIGPTSSQFDAFQRNGIVGPFPRRQFRNQGRAPVRFRIFPPPTATQDYPGTLSFRYITNEPVFTPASVTKRFFTANDDQTIIPDRLVILGAKWRWQQAKAFDFGPLQEEYYNWFDGMISDDKGESVVPLDGRGDFGFPDRYGFGYNIPDGGFPST